MSEVNVDPQIFVCVQCLHGGDPSESVFAMIQAQYVYSALGIWSNLGSII